MIRFVPLLILLSGLGYAQTRVAPTLTIGQYSTVYNFLSFSIAAMVTTRPETSRAILYFWPTVAREIKKKMAEAPIAAMEKERKL